MKEAEKILVEVVKGKDEVLGSQHKDTLKSKINYGHTLSSSQSDSKKPQN